FSRACCLPTRSVLRCPTRRSSDLASQDARDPGVLVLSKLAGAAIELSVGAVLVNPYDREGVAEGLERAISMPLAERRERHRAMIDRKSTRLNSSHAKSSYAVFCLK